MSGIALYIGVIQVSPDDGDDGGHGNGGDDDGGGCNDRGGEHCGVHGHDLHKIDMLPVSGIALYVGVIQVSQVDSDTSDDDDGKGGKLAVAIHRHFLH